VPVGGLAVLKTDEDDNDPPEVVASLRLDELISRPKLGFSVDG